MKITFAIQEMAASEVLNIVPAHVYQKIKKQDKHPLFKAFVIGHEGESTGQVAVDGKNLGKVIKDWSKNAIRKLYEKIKMGLALFLGHDDPEKMNIHDNREQIGEIVGKDLREIDDRLSTVVVGYIYPPYKKQKIDIASIEAFINVDETGESKEIDVESVTGIALADKNYETPGFPHAKLLAQLQAFTTNHTAKGGDDMIELTIGKVIDFVRTEKVRPSELFKKAEIAEDPLVEEIIKEKNPNEYEARKRVEKEHEKEKEVWEKEKKILEDKLKELKVAAVKTSIKDRFENIAQARKLSDQEQKFIQRNLGKFKLETESDDEKDIEKEFDKYVDSQLDEFNAIQKEVFGKEETPEDNGETPDLKSKGKETSDVDENDFIPD
jgi:hypothetical protein